MCDDAEVFGPAEAAIDRILQAAASATAGADSATAVPKDLRKHPSITRKDNDKFYAQP